MGADPNVDYGELWAAVHDYLIVQARQGEGDDANALALGKAMDRMRQAHNMIHDRYVTEPESDSRVAGS